ncbi:hypothetical protein HPB50_023741 [Hyalomma asiaticum]|uniref:Uncharacterized protein n=1 Tax=Hyalomma asiaticum TaxID=266040 RepID=A0ACB7SML8_HYAAI|nr:hypothetical protein HPB50_023741 [Hyalomma asiaticum]
MTDKSKVYKQRFRHCWLTEDKYKEWLMAMPQDPFKAFCKFCKCSIEAKKEVSSYKDAHGENPFTELATLAMTVLSLPFSNTGIERCFSDMSIVKCRRRNRLDIDTLNALLKVRYGLRRHKKKCHEYSLPDDVAAKIGTMASYAMAEEDALQLADIIQEFCTPLD